MSTVQGADRCQINEKSRRCDLAQAHLLQRALIHHRGESGESTKTQENDQEKMTTLAEKKHMGRVAELGCAVCRRMGYPGTPAELHHPRAGTGAGRRASHWDVIPLCPEHHRGKTGLHGLGTKGFPKHWGYDEADLLADTKKLLELG